MSTRKRGPSLVLIPTPDFSALTEPLISPSIGSASGRTQTVPALDVSRRAGYQLPTTPASHALTHSEIPHADYNIPAPAYSSSAPTYFDADHSYNSTPNSKSSSSVFGTPRLWRTRFRLPRAVNPVYLIVALLLFAVCTLRMNAVTIQEAPETVYESVYVRPDKQVLIEDSTRAYLAANPGSNATSSTIFEPKLNGHLYVSESELARGLSEHPIHALIRNATAKWEAKIGRQSVTYSQAVTEYKKRYKQGPPRGFQDWFEFAKENQVQLVDEYDQIHQSLEPFFALPPQLLRDRLETAKLYDWTYTLSIRSGQVSLRGAHRKSARARDQRDFVEMFAQFLPDLDIVMSTHDGPAILLNHDLRKAHLQAARRGSLLTPQQAEAVRDDPAQHGWTLACPPNSPFRRMADGLEYDAKHGSAMSFVADHVGTMDLCSNPEMQFHHGFTSWHGARPSPLFPIFSLSKTTLHSDILAVPLEQILAEETVSDPDWDDKPFNQVVWRGSTTGVWHDRFSHWRSSQRHRLVNLMHDSSRKGAPPKRIRFTVDSAGDELVVEMPVNLEDAVKRYLEFGFAGTLTQCSTEDGSCDAIPPHINFSEPLSWAQQNDYRYVLDVDGNAWSGRFHRLMGSNAAVLKSSIFPEWYSDRIQAWVHYIPVGVDYDDLFDIMAFFAGDLQGFGGHNHLAKAIASQGKEWTAKHWRIEDMASYAFRLYLEYGRLINRT